jgi:transcriptional regulator with XRE-family HTH domain
LDILADKGGALDELEVQRVKDLELQSTELELRDFRRSLIYVKCSQRQWTRRQAAARMGVSQSTVDRIMADPSDIPERLIRHMEADEDKKMTLVIAKCLDSMLADEDRIDESSLRDLATTLGIVNQNRQLQRGNPTAISEIRERPVADILRQLRERRADLRKTLESATEADFETVGPD